MKIVINVRHGGFGLSEKAIIRYNTLKGRTIWVISDDRFSFKTYSLVPPEERIDVSDRTQSFAPDGWHTWSMEEKGAWNQKYKDQTFSDYDIPRDDPILIQVIEELGEFADGRHAELKIVEIPDDVEWQIDEYDGVEWVAEKHRTWS
jgi:hypothetical protein